MVQAEARSRSRARGQALSESKVRSVPAHCYIADEETSNASPIIAGIGAPGPLPDCALTLTTFTR